jgi:hypothetical protein
MTISTKSGLLNDAASDRRSRCQNSRSVTKVSKANNQFGRADPVSESNAQTHGGRLGDIDAHYYLILVPAPPQPSCATFGGESRSMNPCDRSTAVNRPVRAEIICKGPCEVNARTGPLPTCELIRVPSKRTFRSAIKCQTRTNHSGSPASLKPSAYLAPSSARRKGRMLVTSAIRRIGFRRGLAMRLNAAKFSTRKLARARYAAWRRIRPWVRPRRSRPYP